MIKFLETVSFSSLVNWSVRYLKESEIGFKDDFTLYRIGDFLIRNRDIVEIDDSTEYQRVTIKLYNKGVLERNKALGKNIGTKQQFVASEGQFIMSKIDARNGAFGIVPMELNGAIITNDFPSYNVDKKKMLPRFLTLLTSTDKFLQFCQSSSSGSTGRQRVKEKEFLDIRIPLPSLQVQNKIVDAYYDNIYEAIDCDEQAGRLEEDIEKYLFNELGINVAEEKNTIGLSFVNYKDIDMWSVNKISNTIRYNSSKYAVTSFSVDSSLYHGLFRGKSPKYDSSSEHTILNQKCIRWNSIEVKYSKPVNELWLNKLDDTFFTKENDILINSTGEGTIGRGALVNKEFTQLLYDSHIICLRLNENMVSPLFFIHLFNSRYGQSQVNGVKSAQTTKQTELGVGNLSRIFFPLPSIKKQKAIGDKISKMKTEIKEKHTLAQNLRKDAIVAFEKEIFA